MFSVKILVLCSFFALLNGMSLERGDKCEIQNDFFGGQCQLFYDCIQAMTDFEKGIRPTICGFDGKMPLVCCQERMARISISGERCFEYSRTQLRSRFKPKDSKISNKMDLNTTDLTPFWQNNDDEYFNVNTAQAVGGQLSNEQEFPHMAALGYGDEKNPRWLCGGTLISDKYILTAAHCLRSRDAGPVKYIRLGDLNLYTNADAAEVQNFKIAKIHKHPGYLLPDKYHDIALIELDKFVIFNDWVYPACLHEQNDVPNVTLTATGWGFTEEHGSPSDHLIKVDLEYYSNDECSRHYRPQRALTQGIVEENMFCAGSRTQDKGTCSGDSGGPLQMKTIGTDHMYTVVGITSFGRGCATEPGVYVRVSRYIPWIENIVWRNQKLI